MNKLQQAVLKTLAYAGVFNYPLTISEIRKFLIGYKLKDETKLSFLFRRHNLPITEHHGYLTLNPKGSKTGGSQQARTANTGESDKTLNPKGYEYKLVRERRGREERARQLIKKARRFTRKYLHWIPTLKMVAVTGSTAALNADKEADIDLLIVTQRGSKWLTRAFVLVVLEWQRERIDLRKSPAQNAGKFCLNMVLEEDNLAVETHRDASLLYIANEIARMQPIFNRGQTYERFLEENAWVWEILPNRQETWKTAETYAESRGKISFNALLGPLEKFAEWYQLRNKEKWDQIKTDHSQEIMKEYRRRLTTLGINPRSSA